MAEKKEDLVSFKEMGITNEFLEAYEAWLEELKSDRLRGIEYWFYSKVRVYLEEVLSEEASAADVVLTYDLEDKVIDKMLRTTEGENAYYIMDCYLSTNYGNLDMIIESFVYDVFEQIYNDGRAYLYGYDSGNQFTEEEEDVIEEYFSTPLLFGDFRLFSHWNKVIFVQYYIENELWRDFDFNGTRKVDQEMRDVMDGIFRDFIN